MTRNVSSVRSVRFPLVVELLETRTMLSVVSSLTPPALVGQAIAPASQVRSLPASTEYDGSGTSDADAATYTVSSANPLCVNGIGPLPPASGPSLPAVAPAPAPTTPVLLPVQAAPSDLASALLAVADTAPRAQVNVATAGSEPTRTGPSKTSSVPVLSMSPPLNGAENGTAPAPATAASSPSPALDLLFSLEQPVGSFDLERGDMDRVATTAPITVTRMPDQTSVAGLPAQPKDMPTNERGGVLAPERQERPDSTAAPTVDTSSGSAESLSEGTSAAPVADGDVRRGEWLAAALAFSSLVAWAHFYPHGSLWSNRSETGRWKLKADPRTE